MQWFSGLRKQVGVLMVALVLAMSVSAVCDGKSDHPGVDKTIFIPKRPQQV